MKDNFIQYLLKKRLGSVFTFCAFILLPHFAVASEFITEELNRPEQKQSTWMVLPYIFSSDSMGLTGGAVAIFDGFVQPQMTIVATAFMGEELDVKETFNNEADQKRTQGGMLAVSSYNPSFSDRLFISFLGAYAYYPNQRLYLEGGNDSVKDLESDTLTPLQTQGDNDWFNLDFRYVLPWGESENTILPEIQLRRGIAVNRDLTGGGEVFTSGQTILGSEIFYSEWSAERFIEEPAINSNGLRLYLEHNNTDYPRNPSRGYAFTGKLSADFGLGNSTQSWNALEFDYSHYIELPNFSWSRQNVLAFNGWTAYSPSWDKSAKLHPNGVLDKHQTPMWEGARLGGWTRMRAYDSNRFNDKAAIYGAIEYRLIPSLNPMADQHWSPFPIDWFQTVIFVEAGRVAEQYNITTLLSDMKFDVGFSVRALAAKVPVRFEMAFGDEGSAMWVMLNQPF